jgi:16S rRNA (guanine966-N2)-methyltransferase
VTRIISGRAGSIILEVPDSGTRPTSDRVRESLFGALESADALRGARVLDVYAGSGALGLEALSRGAASVDLVEKAPRAAGVAQRNADRVLRAVPGGSVRVHRTAADAYLRTARGPFDVVFLDPPYDLDDSALVSALTLLVSALSPDAIVVIERATRSGAPTLPEGLAHDRAKAYGDTTLWWVSPDVDDQPSEESQSR